MNQDWDQLWKDYAGSAEENPAQAFRRKLVLEGLDLPPGGEGARVLDIGSGQGDFSLQLRALFPKAAVRGLDLSPSGVAMAREKVPDGEFLQADLMEPVAAPAEWRGWATHAVCSELLEHVPEPSRVLANTAPFLAPWARLVVTVPAGPRSAFDLHIGHLRHFGAGDLRDLLEASGFRVDQVWRAGFPFFNLYRLTVVARGRRLVQDVSRNQDGRPLPWAARTTMKAFGWLFRANAVRRGPGWQLVALCRRGEAAAPSKDGTPP